MIKLKTEEHFEYLKEEEDYFLIDPLFYSAYNFARKRLKVEFPSEEDLKTIKTEKPYYSIYIPLTPGMVLKSQSTELLDVDSFHFEKIEVTNFLFSLMEILPKYKRFEFYIQDDSLIRESDVSLRGSKSLGGTFGSYSFPGDVDKLKRRTYKRGNIEYPTIFNVNHNFIYYSLGNLSFNKGITDDFELSSLNDYLNLFNYLTSETLHVLDEVSPYRDMVTSSLANAENEARASFMGLLKPRLYSLDEYLIDVLDSSRSLVSVIQTPIKVTRSEEQSYSEKQLMRNKENYYYERTPLSQQILGNFQELSDKTMPIAIDDLFLSKGLNLETTIMSQEGHFYGYSTRRMDREINSVQNDVLVKFKTEADKFKAKETSEGATP